MRILIADDHRLFGDTICQYIAREGDVEAPVLVSTLDDAIKKIEQSENKPELVLLDMRMPGMHGLKGLEKVRAFYPEIRIALMSGLAESKDIEQAIGMGIVGYLPKTMSGQAMIKAIKMILAGDVYFAYDPEVRGFKKSYQDDVREEDQDLSAISLTPRERDVLKYLLKGQPNQDIASALGLQEVTIKLHVRSICRKFGAANRTQAALKAREMGYDYRAL